MGIGLLLPHDAALRFAAIKTGVEQAQVLLYAHARGLEQGFFERPHLQPIAQRLGSLLVMGEFGRAQACLCHGWADGAGIRLDVYAQGMRRVATHDGEVALAVAEVELPLGTIEQIRFAMRVVTQAQVCTNRQAHAAAQPSMGILTQGHAALGKV